MAVIARRLSKDSGPVTGVPDSAVKVSKQSALERGIGAWSYLQQRLLVQYSCV